MNKKSFLYLFILCTSLVLMNIIIHKKIYSKSEKETIEKIETLLKSSEQYKITDNKRSIQNAKYAIELSEKTDDPDLLVKSYLSMASSLIYINKIEKGMLYIEKAQKLNYKEMDFETKIKLKELKSTCYRNLALDNYYLNEAYGILNDIRIQKKQNKNIELYKYRTIINIGTFYLDKNVEDSAKKYFKIAKNILNDNLNNNVFPKYFLPNYYKLTGNYYLKYNQRDSALIVLTKSLSLVEKIKNHPKDTYFGTLAYYYLETGEYIKAIDYYTQALDDIYKHNEQTPEYKLDIYQKIALCYNKLQQPENERKYLQKYQTDTEIWKKQKARDSKKVVDLILTDEESKTENNQVIKYSLLIILNIGIIIWAYLKYKKLQKKKKISYRAAQNIIDEQKKILQLKDIETASLKKKNNAAICEVIELAKHNSLEFFPRFQELYPDFINSLLEKQPKLQTSELIFCSYIFLNFSTKDIAEYTFVTIRAVQIRKNRLRKKLRILSEEDLGVWMRNLNVEKYIN